MVSKWFWIIGVGGTLYLVLVLGIIGLFNLDLPLYGFKPQQDSSIWYIGFSVIGIWALVFRYTGRVLLHRKHCEVTSYIEGALVTGLVITVAMFFTNRMNEDLPILFILSAKAGFIGVILYRYEKGKRIIPRFR